LDRDFSTLPEEEATRRWSEIWTRIRQLRPSSSTALGAIIDAEGHIETQPEKIADSLRVHWKEVFKREGIDVQKHDRWMSVLRPTWQTTPIDSTVEHWAITKKDVEWAVRHARSTTPGPDGISSHMWRRLGRIATKLLYEVARDMEHSDFHRQVTEAYKDRSAREHDFNLNLLFCIPKKAVRQDENIGPVYTAEGTRPISVADFSNRIIAAAFKHRWEPIMSRWISAEQRGFIPGRSMLDNVVELEHRMMEEAISEERPLAILIDFRAAFSEYQARIPPQDDGGDWFAQAGYPGHLALL